MGEEFEVMFGKEEAAAAQLSVSLQRGNPQHSLAFSIGKSFSPSNHPFLNLQIFVFSFPAHK